MRILVVTDAIPRVDFDSGYRRLAAILQHVSGRHTIFIVARHISEEPSLRAKAAQHLRSLGVSEVWEGEWVLSKILRQHRFDVGYFHYFHTAEWALEAFRRANPDGRTVVDSGDLHYIREETAAAVGTVTAAHAARIRERESAIYHAADLVITNSGEDDEIFRREFPGTPSVMVANIVPIRPRPKLTRTDRLFFVGNFSHHPNVDGILWFAREILPRILQSRPETILEIGGRRAPAELEKLPASTAIHCLGWVPETDPYLDSARVVVAPLRFGGGMKGKVSESLASGVPTVTTTFGAQGFGAVDGTHLRIADEPSTFASTVVEMLADEAKAEQIGANGQELVRSICSLEVVRGKVDEVMDHLARTSTRGVNRPCARARFVAGSLLLDLGRRLQRVGAHATALE